MEDTIKNSNTDKSKITIASGVLNIVSGAILFLDAVLFAIAAIVCLMMVVTPFIIAAVPMFFILGFIGLLALGAAIADEIVGIGSVITSAKGGTPSRIFTIISVAVNAIILLPNILSLINNVFCLIGETESIGIWIALIVINSLSIIIALTCLIINAYALKSKKYN